MKSIFEKPRPVSRQNNCKEQKYWWFLVQLLYECWRDKCRWPLSVIRIKTSGIMVPGLEVSQPLELLPVPMGHSRLVETISTSRVSMTIIRWWPLTPYLQDQSFFYVEWVTHYTTRTMLCHKRRCCSAICNFSNLFIINSTIKS